MKNSLYFIVYIRNATSETPEIFLVGKEKVMFVSYDIIISITLFPFLMFNLNFSADEDDYVFYGVCITPNTDYIKIEIY